MATVFIALGSNLGDRAAALAAAVAELRRQPDVEVVRVSSWWETEPVGGPPGQGKFLNGAAEVRTSLAPQPLLHLLLAIERRLGRERSVRNGPRTLDLDLLLYDDLVHQEPGLELPHPRLHERTFVLGPMLELAPQLRHPELDRTVVDLYSAAVRREHGPLRGLRILVTGSSSGIGAAIAREAARQGAAVVVHAAHNRTGAETVARQIRQAAASSCMVMADLADPAAAARLVDTAWSAWDGLDGVVNNAGADILTGEGAKLDFGQKLDRLWAVDVRGTMLVSRAIGVKMRAVGRGAILTMGWDQAETGMAGDSGQLFAAVKAAVAGFAKSLAVSLAPQVRVNNLAPGWIRTAWGETASAEWQARAVREAPLARWGSPDDVAGAACWLLSPAAEFITGQTLRVNGGAVR